VVVGRINEVVALTGFSYKVKQKRFPGTKKWPHKRGGRIKEVTVRQGFHCSCKLRSS